MCARCENVACGHTAIAYNSCRKPALPEVPECGVTPMAGRPRSGAVAGCPTSSNVVYTLPSELREIAYQNKRVVYDLLMKAAAETDAHHRRRSQPSRRADRCYGRAAHLGSALTQNPHTR